MNEKIKRVKALTFDVFGTVVDWRTSLIAETKEYARRTGFDIDWVSLVDQWRADYFPQMERVTRGELPWTKLDVLHRMTLDRLLHEFGVTGVDEETLDWMNRGWHRLKPWPDVLAGLKRLRTRYPLVALSNGNVSLLMDMAKASDIPWDCILSAENARRYKPEPEAYLVAAELLSLKPEEVMLVGAHNGDAEGAAAVGFANAFVYRTTEYGPHQTIDFEPEAKQDIVAKDFGDLADQLGC